MSLIGRLSPELLAHILRRLFEGVSELAYVLELRLVCKKFDDMVVHELFNVGDYQLVAPYKTIIVHASFPHEAEPMCLVRGTKKHAFKETCWVKRQYLLSRMMHPRSKDPKRIAFFQQLRAAAQDLEYILTRDSLLNVNLQSSLSIPLHPEAFGSVSEISSAIVCEAALSLLDVDAVLDHSKPFPPQLCIDADPTFWLVNVACWAGSRTLLNLLEARISPMVSRQSPVVAAAQLCLPAAIRQDERDFVEYILGIGPLPLSEHERHHLCPIQAAIIVGDLDTVDRISESFQITTISQRLSAALLMTRPDLDRKGVYLTILQLLLPKLREIVADLRPMYLSLLTMHIADTCGHDGIDLLKSYDLLSARNVQALNGLHSALDAPSCKGDVQTLSRLFDVDYLGDIDSRRGSKAAIVQAANKALSWSQLSAFEELRKHAGTMLAGDDWLSHQFIASAGSTSNHLKESVESAHMLLQRPITKTCIQTEQNTVGQAALERAIQFLKPANVEVILDAGIRLAPGQQALRVSWTYSRRHQLAFDTTQQLLARYELPLIVAKP